MSATDKSSAIRNFRKVIDSMEREEMTMVMGVYGDALKQIVGIAKEHSLSLRHIELDFPRCSRQLGPMISS